MDKPRLVGGLVTEEWLRWYANGPAGWNARQLSAIGVSWPPKKGWLVGLVGTQITPDQEKSFERFSRTIRKDPAICPCCGQRKPGC